MLDIKVEQENSRPVLKVGGDIDFYTGPLFLEQLLALLHSGHRHLTVEAPRQAFDPSGIAIMQIVSSWLEKRAGRLELRPPLS